LVRANAAFVRANAYPQPERALALLEEMKSLGERFSPSVYTYNEVFRSFAGTENALARLDALLPEMLGRCAPRPVQRLLYPLPVLSVATCGMLLCR
jgi:hypothetical protein